jgi:hypothetical protein
MSRHVCCIAGWLALALTGVLASDFEVTTTNDAGAGSYRQAIVDSNDNPGPDRIIFNIPGGGVQSIQPLTPLPAFTGPVVVDGYTQPGARANTLSNRIEAVLLIQLDGSLAPRTGSSGVRFSGGSSTVRGLIINGFGMGVWLDSSSNRVAGNFIGTDPSGLTARGNGDAIYLQRVGDGPPALDPTYLRPSCCHVIGGTDPSDRNLISGNDVYPFHVGEGWLVD